MSKNFRQILNSLTICLTIICLEIPLTSSSNNKRMISYSRVSVFIKNQGQIIDQNNRLNPNALYLLNMPGMNVQLRKTGFSYDVYSIEKNLNNVQTSYLETSMHQNNQESIYPDGILSTFYYHRIDIDFLNCNPSCTIIPSDQVEDYLNYSSFAGKI